MHLLIARHGETVWNAELRIQGWGDSPLTELGLTQAGYLRERLWSVSLAGAYCSDLGRAVQTASIVTSGHDVALTTLPELRETSWGDWEGKTAQELDSEQPELWAKFKLRGREMNQSDDEADWESSTVVPNGETLANASHRIALAVASIRERHKDVNDHVLIVGHGGSLRFIITQALGLPPRRVRRFHLDNASLTHIVYSETQPPLLKSLNDTGHHAGWNT